MQSYTYGEVSIPQIAEILLDYAAKNRGAKLNLVVGTDSQTESKTKVVVVIALHHVGHGGFFFQETQVLPRIRNLRQKLQYETQQSLECIDALMAELEKAGKKRGLDPHDLFQYAIHVDAGENGPTMQLIPELVGWVRACGYEAVTKPKSYAASTLADTLSK